MSDPKKAEALRQHLDAMKATAGWTAVWKLYEAELAQADANILNIPVPPWQDADGIAMELRYRQGVREGALLLKRLMLTLDEMVSNGEVPEVLR